jgi:hypothetical protein
LVIQNVRFTIETKTGLFARLELCGFITDHLPRLFAAERPSDSKVPRTDVLVRHRHPGPKTPRARLQRDIPHLQGSQGRGMHPKIRLDPEAPVPSQVSQMAHQLRIGKAAIGQKHHLTGTRYACLGLLSPVFGRLKGHGGAPVLDHLPPQRHRTPSGNHGEAPEALGLPPHGGIPRHRPPLAQPAHPRLRDQGAIERLRLEAVIVEPTATAPHDTLRLARSTDHTRRPCPQTHGLRAEQAHHHPRQGLTVAPVEPRGMLAQNTQQRIIQRRCALHGVLLEWPVA